MCQRTVVIDVDVVSVACAVPAVLVVERWIGGWYGGEILAWERLETLSSRVGCQSLGVGSNVATSVDVCLYEWSPRIGHGQTRRIAGMSKWQHPEWRWR